MIELSSTSMLGVLSQSPLSSSKSLSIAQSVKIRGQWAGLEHISEVLPRILATIDRQPLGKLSEQGGGIPPGRPPENQKQSPLLVTTSYPSNGGVS
jgi:hypothetical protein